MPFSSTANKPAQGQGHGQVGLKDLFCSQNPRVDIVFVHGLNGDRIATWTNKDNGVCWPADLLPQFLDPIGVRVMTYGYNANVAAFTDGSVSRDKIHHHAETLASSLVANRSLRGCAERPIIWVCHSLGGLVVKRLLVLCRNTTNEKIEHLRTLYVSTYGILFLGTPHNGSDIAKWGLLLQKICNAVLPKSILESSPHLVNALKTNNETLQNINALFADMMGRFHVYFFHETQSTNLKGSRDIIVDETSAAPYIEGTERMGIEADHSNMCKFADENAPGFEAVAEALVRYSKDASAVIAERWVEERKARFAERMAKANEIYSMGPANRSAASMPDEFTGRNKTLLPAITAKEDAVEEPSEAYFPSRQV